MKLTMESAQEREILLEYNSVQELLLSLKRSPSSPASNSGSIYSRYEQKDRECRLWKEKYRLWKEKYLTCAQSLVECQNQLQRMKHRFIAIQPAEDRKPAAESAQSRHGGLEEDSSSVCLIGHDVEADGEQLLTSRSYTAYQSYSPVHSRTRTVPGFEPKPMPSRVEHVDKPVEGQKPSPPSARPVSLPCSPVPHDVVEKIFKQNGQLKKALISYMTMEDEMTAGEMSLADTIVSCLSATLCEITILNDLM